MSDVQIHSTAIVDPKAELGAGKVIGPYCVIGPDVTMGANCWLQHHVTLCGPTRAGSDNKFYAYCSIGQQSQDLKYRGEPTYLEIGNGNTFREFVTVNRSTSSEGKTVVGATSEAMQMLMDHEWPGNVRQLENAVYRAIVLADAPYLQPHDFPSISGVAAPPPEYQPAPMPAPSASAPAEGGGQEIPVRILDGRGHLRTLEEIERDLIQLAIEVYAGHMSEVARRLGIGRSTLYRKVREQGLDGLVKGETETSEEEVAA